MKPSSRQRALEEWRGLPDAGPSPDRAMTVGAVLQTLAPQLGLESRLLEEEILTAWAEVVGPFFAAHSRPSRIQQGTLLVQVLQPTVLYELDRQWKAAIVAKLRERFGDRRVQTVKFRLG